VDGPDHLNDTLETWQPALPPPTIPMGLNDRERHDLLVWALVATFALGAIVTVVATMSLANAIDRLVSAPMCRP
jgi:hypothetical protein